MEKDLKDFFNRWFVGFDPYLLAAQRGSSTNYPPYNIVKLSDQSYQITIAVAGFAKEDIEVTIEGNSLAVTGKTDTNGTDVQYLYRGLSMRDFTRKFTLADEVEVDNVNLKNGILAITLKRIQQEEAKVRKVKIND